MPDAAPSPRRPTRIPRTETAEATVFVVHADLSVRETMAGVLREAGHAVRAFASPGAFLAAMPSTAAGCAVLHVQLPELSGLEVRDALRARGCALPLVFTSEDGPVRVAVEAMKAGAVDFLIEPVDDEPLLAAVALALVRDAQARAARAGREAVAALSARERQVCDRVARGVINKEIATELGISESSVRLYRAEGMKKLGVGSAAELGGLLARLGGLLAGEG